MSQFDYRVMLSLAETIAGHLHKARAANASGDTKAEAVCMASAAEEASKLKVLADILVIALVKGADKEPSLTWHDAAVLAKRVYAETEKQEQ